MKRRGMVLLGVMVVVAMAALAGTKAMYLAQAELASSRTALKRTQSRAASWSGVQAVMAELADQRDNLLDGQAPELSAQWDLYAEESGLRCVVRMVPWGEDGPLAQSENAKLDLNSATAEMLKKIGLSESEGAAVVAARGSGKFASVGDLARVTGFDARRLEEAQALPRISAGEGPGESGLRDLVTVFSFDPNIQCGLGNNGADHRGNLRVNLHTSWSDRLAGAIDDRFGNGASAGLKALFDRGTKFESMADVAKAAQQAGLPTASWGPIFEALTVTEDPYLTGLVDLNTAPSRVLACIPGVSAAAADQVVEARSSLGPDERRSVCWLLGHEILGAAEFAQAVDHITTRSMQWRVRIEAGTVTGDPGRDSATISLSDRVVLEAVIDVASERPRVAYLRDVTLEGAMASVYAAHAAQAAEADVPEPLASPDPATPAPAPHSTDLNLGTDLNLHTDLDLSSGMDKGFGDLKLGSGEPSGPIDNASGARDVPAPAPAEPGVDRRVGRWTTGERKAGG